MVPIAAIPTVKVLNPRASISSSGLCRFPLGGYHGAGEVEEERRRVWVEALTARAVVEERGRRGSDEEEEGGGGVAARVAR